MTLTGLVVALLVKPSAVVGVAYVATTVLRRSVAPVRHTMWLVAIAVILVLPALGAVLPAIHVGAFAGVERGVSPGPTETQTVPAANATARPGSPGPVAQVPGAPNDNSANSGRLVVLLAFTTWAVVGLILVGRRILAELRAAVIAAEADAAPDRIHRIALRAFRRWRSREVGIRVTDRVAGPVVVGLRKPVVLLPATIESHSDADIETILLHEVGHAKRHDCLTNFMADVAACIYWCNPLVRRAAARMQLEGERSCDEGVVRGGVDVIAYAHLLLSIARAGQGKDALAPAARAMSRARELESRIVALMDPAQAPLGRRRSALALTIGVSLTLPAAALSPGARTAVAPPTVRVEQGPDSVASPQSERVPMVISDRELAVRVAGALAGPDSALAVPFIEAMGRAPQHEYDLVAERARWVIARVSGGKLVEPLLESLSDPDWRVKAYAAWALGTIQDSRAVPALVGLVRHPVWRLRAMAAYALAVSGDPRAAGVFREALNDPAWQVREQAVRYFAGIDSDDARELVLRARTDKHVAVRMAAER